FPHVLCVSVSVSLFVSIETRVQIQESVRGKDVFVIQTVSKDVNTTIMEMLITVYACRTSCARSITGVLPYFPYSKQCKMRKRGSIVTKLMASMMCKAGLTHLITMDLHQKEIQGFFNIPVDNLRASPFLLQYIQEEIPDYRNAVIVAKSPSSAKSFVAAAETLKERGAYKIFVMATHGILSSDAPRFIEESAIDEVVVTNTIPHELQKLQCPKIKTVDISMILAEAIRRIHNGESMSYLFRNIAVDD
ncbi:hypothetical protein CRUP_001986, partial [Coryphaenoides rupestris]